MKIAVDPGHGLSNSKSNVYDPGAVHASEGTKYEEAAITLRYGLELRNIFLERGHQVFMTRENADDPAPVGERAGKAEEAGCDAFVSIHLNANDDERANGLEVLYRNEDYRELADALRDALCSVSRLKARESKRRVDLAVLKFDGPAVLIELGFISNGGDRQILLNPAISQGISEKIVEVVADYLA